MRRFAIYLILIAACACSAQNHEILPPLPEEQISHGMIVLGEKLEDPYSVDNMSKALASLYPTKAVSVSTTHFYVRFLPSDQGQYELLEELGVEMLDHPVDFSILKEGDYYHDPDIPEGDITWQYAVVPPDFPFPSGIEYEILDRCHIAEQPLATRSPDGIDWEAVERESFRLTGNAGMLLAAKGDDVSSSPEGHIRIIDDFKSKEAFGVAGVKVSCNVFVKFAHAYTDEDGHYKIEKAFNSEPRYRIVFKNKKGFGIGLNLIFFPASVSTLGKQSPSGCSITVNKRSDRALFRRCVVNNAGWDYYNICHSDAGMLSLPPSNLRIWLFDLLSCSSAIMLQQGVLLDGSIIEDYLGKYYSLVKFFLPDITLGLQYCEDYPSIYAASIHELAHTSHYMQVGNDYWNKLAEYVIKSFITSGFITYGVGTEKDHGYCEVAEMWAYYMQTRLFRERYSGSGAAFGTTFWFFPQIFNYMDERGLTCYKTFNALTPDVHDKEALRMKLLRLYPDAKTLINLAFSSYK